MTTPSTVPRFRFSLRWLLVLTAIIAVVLGLLSFPLGLLVANWGLSVLLRGVVPTIAVVGVVFARGDWRAFSLGALVATVPQLFGSAAGFYDLTSALLAFVLPIANVALCGSFAVVARRWLARRGLANEL